MSEIKYRLAVDPSNLPGQLNSAERMFDAHSAAIIAAMGSMRMASQRFGDQHLGAVTRSIDATERLEQAMGRIGGVVSMALGGLGVGQLAGMMATMADEVTAMEGRLRQATGTSRAFAQAQEEIDGIADRQRAGLSGVSDLYTRLTGVSVDLEASQADVARVTEAVAASLLLNNTQGQASSAVLTQLGQALGGAKIQAEEFNSILDGARPLLVAAAKHIEGTGGSVSKLKELVDDGKVSSKEFFAAMLASSEELKNSTASLPVTIGQATTFFRNDALKLVGDLDKVTGGSQLVAESIRGLGGQLDTLAVAGAALGGVMVAKLTQSLLGMVNARIVDNALAVQGLRATVLQTDALVVQASAQVAAAQSMNLGVGSASALAAAESRLAAVQAARTSAQSALTAATSAGGVAASVAGGALSMLGGPLGLGLTLLTAGATAWALWGGASTKAGEKALTIGEQLDEVNERLEREVALLRERNGLKAQGKDSLAAASDGDLEKAKKARERLVAIEGELAEARGLNASTLKLENEQYELQFKLRSTERNAEANASERRTAQVREEGDARTKWLAQLGDKSVQLQQELKKARKDFDGVIPPDVEAAIRKKFADPVKDVTADLAKAGKKLYSDLTADAGGLAGDFAEKWDSLSAAYKKNSLSLEQLTYGQSQLLAQQPAIKEARDGEAKAAQLAREEVEKQYISSVKAAEQSAKAVAERVAALQVEEAAMAMAAASNLTLAEAIERVQIARLQEAAKAAGENGEQERLDAINAEIAARQKLAQLAGGKELRDQAKEAGDSLKAYLGKDIGANLAAGFDRASQSLGAFVGGVRDLAGAQEAQAQAMRDNLKANSGDLAKFAKVQEQITAKGTAQQINAYGNIAGAAKGFFKEGTKGYKGLETAERIFRAFELAMSAKAIVQRLFEVNTVTAAKVAGDTLSAQSGTAAAATEAAASLAKGQAAAAAGIANQSGGDPYTAFPRIAAMAAMMAGLGFLVGGMGGGGGAEPEPGNTGAGTVFGDKSAKSESLGNAMDLLAQNSDIGLRYSQGMLAALRNIESNIGGLTGMLLRSGSLTGNVAGNFGIDEGTRVSGGAAKSLLTGGPIGGAAYAVDKLLLGGKVTAALFGSTTKITGNGLYAGQQGLGGIVKDGLNLQDYAVENKRDRFLGVTYSNSYNTQYRKSDPVLQQQFGQVFKDLYGAIKVAAGPLDEALDVVTQRLDSFVVNIGRIDLKDLSGQQIQEKLGAVLGAAADGVASAALPGLDAFQRVGEGYFETVVRVASGVEYARAELDRLGIASIAYGDIAAKQGDVDRELIRGSLLAWEQARHGLNSGVGEIVKAFAGSAAELSSLWQNLGAMRDGLRAIGADVASLSADMVRGAGGADALSEGLQAYFDSFLTEGERTAEKSRRMAEKFAAAGVAMPASAESFRRLVGGIDTSTAAGQLLFGKVIALSGAFAELQEALVTTDEKAQALAERRYELEGRLHQLQGNTAELRARELVKLDASLHPMQERIWALESEQAAVQAATQLATQRQQLEGQILQLQGNTAALRALERDRLDASLRPLQDRIWALQDEQVAAQSAAQAQQQLASQRTQLEDRLLQAQGNTVELRARELARLDAGLRPMQERIWALESEQAAAQAAAQAQQQLAGQRTQLEDQLLQLQGNTAALRLRELAELDASLRPLQERIWALEVEKAAAQAATDAAARASDAWRNLGDGLVSEIKRIQGVLTDGAGLGFDSLQAQFAIDTAAARAGDQEAAGRLSQLSGSMLAAAEANAGSSVELRRLQGYTLASLESTLGQINAMQGTAPGAALAAAPGAGLSYVPPAVPGDAASANSPMAEMVRELRELRQEVARMRGEQESSQYAIADNTRRAAKVLERVAPDGEAVLTRLAV